MQNTTPGARVRREDSTSAASVSIGRLHSYVDRNNSGCYYEPARGAPRSTGTLPSPQPSLMLPFVVCQAQPQWSTTAPHRDTFDTPTPWTSGDTQTHTHRLLLPSCLIKILLLGCVWNSGTAPVDVYRFSNAVFENTVLYIH